MKKKEVLPSKVEDTKCRTQRDGLGKWPRTRVLSEYAKCRGVCVRWPLPRLPLSSSWMQEAFVSAPPAPLVSEAATLLGSLLGSQGLGGHRTQRALSDYLFY